jgi:inositol-phosphate phosphatase / L-galactose 1-phosphate phosphatase / histidinol-phosphatase
VDSLLSKVIASVKAATDTARLEFRSKQRILRKDAYELVSETDLTIKNLLLDLLADTLPIVHEEQRSPSLITEATLVIDPIDGTHNFISGIDIFGIAISMVSPRGFHFGVVSIPLKEWMIIGVEGEQTTLNGNPIRVRKTSSLEHALICFDNNFRSSKQIIKQYDVISRNAFTTRITGCATYDGALIAQGLADARIWNATKLCDFSALVPIIRGAGGTITSTQGEAPSLNDTKLVASNGHIHTKLLNLINRSDQGSTAQVD